MTDPKKAAEDLQDTEFDEVELTEEDLDDVAGGALDKNCNNTQCCNAELDEPTV